MLEHVRQLFSSHVKHLGSFDPQARQFPVAVSTYLPDGHSHSLVVEPGFGINEFEHVVQVVALQAVHCDEVLLQGWQLPMASTY
jgi:hypothetical protein